MFLRPLLVLSLVATIAPAVAQPVTETGQRGGVIDVPTADTDMEAAKAEGRATLGDFLAVAAAPKPGQRDFGVKVGFRGPNGRNEFFWVSPFTVRGDRISGTLNDRPVYATQLREGQTVSFGRDEVVDWYYFDGPVMRGNFTTCVLLSKSSDADREQYRKQMGLDCSR